MDHVRKTKPLPAVTPAKIAPFPLRILLEKSIKHLTKHSSKMGPLTLLLLIMMMMIMMMIPSISGAQILSKSKLQKCEKVSEDSSSLNCTSKIVIDMAVPSESVSAFSLLYFINSYWCKIVCSEWERSFDCGGTSGSGRGR